MSRLDHRLEPEEAVRRFEVINGALNRRRWSNDERARILDETLAPDVSVSAVARRHGLTPQQLFTWRRAARKAMADVLPAFVPAVIAADVVAEHAPPKSPDQRTRRRSSRRRAAAIELEAAGVTVRIGDGASPNTIAAVIGALKAGA